MGSLGSRELPIAIVVALVIISALASGLASHHLTTRIKTVTEFRTTTSTITTPSMLTVPTTTTVTKSITTIVFKTTTQAKISTTTQTIAETITQTITQLQTITEAITVTPLDSDGDGIFDEKELEYGTDPYKPNHLFFYALKKLSKEEALKFKNVENFNASSITLVDLYIDMPLDKRSSKEVGDLLSKILLDDIVNELEKNLFDDIFINPSPPTIINLIWIPTKENLDKIYDINVAFTARDDKTPIAYAELRFIPVEYYYMIERYGMRLEDYPKVFPPDSERVFVLTPIDGVFDSLEESFTVTITDIVGGREYRIVVLVRDLAGNEKVVEVKTPYIRQYENLAETDDVIVTALYLLWWQRDKWVNDYRCGVFPILRKYSSKDIMVINKHVDWATGHGIDVFFINWAGLDYQDKALKYYFLNADLVKKGDIKFAILYETIWRLIDSHPGWNLSDPRNVEILDTDFEYLSRNYFGNPSYFKINGRPVVYIYEGKGVFGDISQIAKLRERYNLFLISDHGHPLANPEHIFPQDSPFAVRWGEAAKLFDALMPAAGLYDGFLWYMNYFKGSNVSDPLDNNKWLEYKKLGNDKWYQFSKDNNLTFIPSVTVGISYRCCPWGDKNWPKLDRDPAQLKERLEFELKYLDNPKILFIAEFNNFFEEAAMEPDSKYGFSLLKTLRDVLERLKHEATVVKLYEDTMSLKDVKSDVENKTIRLIEELYLDKKAALIYGSASLQIYRMKL